MKKKFLAVYVEVGEATDNLSSSMNDILEQIDKINNSDKLEKIYLPMIDGKPLIKIDTIEYETDRVSLEPLGKITPCIIKELKDNKE